MLPGFVDEKEDDKEDKCSPLLSSVAVLMELTSSSPLLLPSLSTIGLFQLLLCKEEEERVGEEGDLRSGDFGSEGDPRRSLDVDPSFKEEWSGDLVVIVNPGWGGTAYSRVMTNGVQRDETGSRFRQ
jgi:hypothetical protein